MKVHWEPRAKMAQRQVAPRHSPPYRKISAETSGDGPGGFVFTPLALWRGVLALQASFGRAGGEALSVWSQRQDETNTDHADETDRKMNPNNPWSRQKENIYIIHLINNIFKTYNDDKKQNITSARAAADSGDGREG